MRLTLSIILAIFISSTTAIPQSSNKSILVIGHGSSPEGEHADIVRYYSVQGFAIKWIDGDQNEWEALDPAEYRILWIHRSDSAPGTGFENERDFYKAVLKFAEMGGSVLLTQHALDFLNNCGIEPVPLAHRSKTSEDNGYGRMLGYHAFLGHPLFDGLNGGAYVWKPPFDTAVTQCGFFGNNVPENGKVIAVDWDYIFVREDAKLVVEYEVGKGKILGIGAYFNLASPNLNKTHYDHFYKNVFDYLSGDKDQQNKHYWQYGNKKAERLDAVFMRQFVAPPSRGWDIHREPMTISKQKADDEYCEAAGQRMLLAAYEPGGIFELWAHPFMALHGYSVSLYMGDSIIVLNEMRPSIEVSPAYVMRTYDAGYFTLNEVLTVSPTGPIAVAHYEYSGPPAKLAVQYKSNMRLMWPYSQDVLQTFLHGFDPGINAIVFRAPEADLTTLVGSNKMPVSKYSGRSIGSYPEFQTGEIIADDEQISDSLFELAAGQLFSFEEQDFLDIVIAAGSDGSEKIQRAYMEALEDPFSILQAARKHYKNIETERLTIISPDSNFNKGFAWALAATDRFFVETPGLGTSLVAGYNGTDRGWDGGHEINGRPGYAWYFGRDAVWSAFAVLDYGDFEGVRKVLDMLIRFQDLNGKIFHELSTSGFVHYDASDATPLFIILAGRYLQCSGDIAYIRNNWPAIEKAINYCKSTDTDGDGLIENTNVGHGWVEGGHLFGSHTSLYLASCWAEALAEAASMSEALGMLDVQADFHSQSLEIIEKIQTEFYNSATGFMYQGIFKDGTYHTGESILPSVPIYFGHIPATETKTMLQAFASVEYTTDWGVGIAPRSSPDYHPRGYHSGSVWPLFTGWVSLAEYKMNRPLQGFMHVMNNLNIYRDFSQGYLEEVLSGEKYTPSGVCPHQCWSETMVIQPVIEGLLGLRPYAMKDSLHFAPSIPDDWDSILVNNILTGETAMDWKMKRNKARTETYFTFNIEEGNTRNIIFEPHFPAGTVINKLLVNGNEIPYDQNESDNGTVLKIDIALHDDLNIKVEHQGGIALIAPQAHPLPNEVSSGIRIINTELTDSTYSITIEGAAGMEYELELMNNLGYPAEVRGAAYRQENNKLYLTAGFPAMMQGYERRHITIIF